MSLFLLLSICRCNQRWGAESPRESLLPKRRWRATWTLSLLARSAIMKNPATSKCKCLQILTCTLNIKTSPYISFCCVFFNRERTRNTGIISCSVCLEEFQTPITCILSPKITIKVTVKIIVANLEVVLIQKGNS